METGIAGLGGVAALAAQTVQAVDGPRGSALASWVPFWAFVAVFVALVTGLVIAARLRRISGPFLGVPALLERRTGVPGWAASTLLLSIYGLALAGTGFYTDVAWHVALGRDDDLFTAPHTAIFVGLCMIAAAPVLGAAVATRQQVPTRLRVGAVRVPWSLLPLGVLGVAALIGFPIDELWHEAYGVDVTMWSPPHLIMILAASFSGLASWLVLSESGVRPTSGAWGRGLHVVTAALTLQGLSSVQGEFSYGVPQWQQLYHPVLVALAAGIALVLIRLAHGPWWALGIAGGIFVVQLLDVLGDDGPVDTRAGAIYLGSAAVVEVVARVAGTDRRLRFALLSGLGIGTAGLAVEWAWNQGAHQPWTSALLPEAVLLGVVAATGAAVIGAALAAAIGRHKPGAPVPRVAVVLAVVAVLVSLAVPAPRRVGDVTASVSLAWVDEERAVVNVTLDPPDAAEGARWFTVGSWQWGGRTVHHLQRTADGYTSGEPLLLTGNAKSLIRLHRGAEMMAVAVRLPADPKYGLAEVPAEDRTAAFVSEQRYLQRETEGGEGWFAMVVYALVVVLLAGWIGSLAVAVARIRDEGVAVPAGRPS